MVNYMKISQFVNTFSYRYKLFTNCYICLGIFFEGQRSKFCWKLVSGCQRYWIFSIQKGRKLGSFHGHVSRFSETRWRIQSQIIKGWRQLSRGCNIWWRNHVHNTLEIWWRSSVLGYILSYTKNRYQEKIIIHLPIFYFSLNCIHFLCYRLYISDDENSWWQ